MDMVQIIGFVLIAAALIAFLRQYKPEFALPVSLIASVIILGIAALSSFEIFKKMNEFAESANVNTEYIKVLLKGVGICYVTQMAADACSDQGETALASKVELSGRIAISVLALPMIADVLSIVMKLIT